MVDLRVNLSGVALDNPVIPASGDVYKRQLMGFIFGLVRGVLLVLLFFTVLVPVLGVIWPDMSETIVGLMDGTRLAELLYDDNMILVLIRDLFS